MTTRDMSVIYVLDKMEKLFDQRSEAVRFISRFTGFPCAQISSATIDGMPRSGRKNEPFESTIDSLEEAFEILRTCESGLDYHSRLVAGTIREIENINHRALMKSRYIDLLSMTECAMVNHYSRSAAYKALKKAKKELLDKLDTHGHTRTHLQV